MKKYIKIASVSLAVSLAVPTGSFAETMREVSTDGAPTVRYVASKVAEGAWEATKMAGNATLTVASTGLNVTYKLGAYMLEGGARLGVAYGASYLGVETLNEAFAYGMYGAAYTVAALSMAGPAAAPTVALTAYTMTRTVLAGLHLIPGIDGALAATYTPVVRNFTDMAIDHGPAAISSACKTAYSVIGTAASFASTSFSSMYSNFYSTFYAAAAA